MAESARADGAIPVFILLRMTSREFEEDEAEKITQMAEAAGGVVIYPLGLFNGYDREQIQLSEGDTHPSVLGHQLIAHSLYEAWLSNADRVGMATEEAPRED
jgi:hypothetical protein